MPKRPPLETSDEEWRAFAEEQCEELKPHMAEFILERFTYKPRYVQQRIWRTFGTVSALSAQFDIYISMFVKPNPTGRESALFSHGSASRKNLLAMDVR